MEHEKIFKSVADWSCYGFELCKTISRALQGQISGTATTMLALNAFDG